MPRQSEKFPTWVVTPDRFASAATRPLAGLEPPLAIHTSRPGSRNGSGRRSNAFTTLKTAVLAPIPSARVTTAISENPGLFINIRAPYRKSCQMDSIGSPPGLRLDRSTRV